MPELPEVETVVNTLKNLILNKTILDVEFLYAPIIDGDKDEFKNAIINREIVDIKRRGKYLIFELSDDVTFYSHLRMEGKYYVLDSGSMPFKHTHVIFKLSDDKELHYNDVRKFGRMGLIKRDDYKVFRGLGPEPFSDEFNLEYAKTYLNNKNKAIKTVLLDQSFVAGVGNIYADEILFEAKVNPFKSASKLNDEEISKIVKATPKILNKAIALGGTTIRSYTSSLGVTGLFQNELNVHTMKSCPICNSEIKKEKINGRMTYYCPICQKLN